MNKKEMRKWKRCDILSALVFLLAGNISINLLRESFWTNLLGALFYIAMLYGFVSILKGKRFIFPIPLRKF